jgi:Flp pilus assembly protein TadB
MSDQEQIQLLIRLEERMKSFSEKQDEMLIQVKKTNGRVSSLEKWRAYLVGGGIVIVTLVGWIIQTK